MVSGSVDCDTIWGNAKAGSNIIYVLPYFTVLSAYICLRDSKVVEGHKNFQQVQ